MNNKEAIKWCEAYKDNMEKDEGKGSSEIDYALSVLRHIIPILKDTK